jgi:hypothetical protein
MTIKQLFTPLTPPPQGLAKLQQALWAQNQTAQPGLAINDAGTGADLRGCQWRPASGWRRWPYQVATVMLLAGVWLGFMPPTQVTTLFAAATSTSMAMPPKLQYTSTSVATAKAAQPLLPLASADPQVKMYWLLTQG